MSLTKYWVRWNQLLVNPDPIRPEDYRQIILAVDVDALHDDPQALAALLVERAGKEKP